MKQRNHAFDFLCGICIIRMMVHHFTSACGFANTDWWTTIMHWSFYFMSFFFFKAGYFNKTTSGDTHEYVIDKTKRLLVPYFVWGWIGCAVYFFFCAFILDSNNALVRDIKWEHLWSTSQFYGNVPCWFLFSFYISYLAMHFIGKVRRLHWAVLVFPFISYGLYKVGNPLWFSLNNVFMGIFLFFLGRLWHISLDKMKRNLSISVSIALIISFVILNQIVGGEYVMSDNIWKGNPIYTVLGIVFALCGISGLLLSVNVPRIPVINYIGEHSMVFFVAHYPLMMFYKMTRSAAVHSLRNHWDDWFILVVFIFIICFLLVPYVENIPWLSGRFPKKTKVTQCKLQ